MTEIIIDASVAIKWLFEEPLQQYARYYLSPQYTRMAPDFIYLELFSATHKKVQFESLRVEDGLNSLRMLFNENVLKLMPFFFYLERAYEIANSIHHSIYDCLYLSLAEQQRSKVVTADRKFYDRVKKTEYAHCISWIEHTIKNS